MDLKPKDYKIGIAILLVAVATVFMHQRIVAAIYSGPNELYPTCTTLSGNGYYCNIGLTPQSGNPLSWPCPGCQCVYVNHTSMSADQLKSAYCQFQSMATTTTLQPLPANNPKNCGSEIPPTGQWLVTQSCHSPTVMETDVVGRSSSGIFVSCTRYDRCPYKCGQYDPFIQGCWDLSVKPIQKMPYYSEKNCALDHDYDWVQYSDYGEVLDTDYKGRGFGSGRYYSVSSMLADVCAPPPTYASLCTPGVDSQYKVTACDFNMYTYTYSTCAGNGRYVDGKQENIDCWQYYRICNSSMVGKFLSTKVDISNTCVHFSPTTTTTSTTTSTTLPPTTTLPPQTTTTTLPECYGTSQSELLSCSSATLLYRDRNCIGGKWQGWVEHTVDCLSYGFTVCDREMFSSADPYSACQEPFSTTIPFPTTTTQPQASTTTLPQKSYVPPADNNQPIVTGEATAINTNKGEIPTNQPVYYLIGILVSAYMLSAFMSFIRGRRIITYKRKV